MSVDERRFFFVHLQKTAQDALRDGLTRIDEILQRRRRVRAQNPPTIG